MYSLSRKVAVGHQVWDLSWQVSFVLDLVILWVTDKDIKNNLCIQNGPDSFVI